MANEMSITQDFRQLTLNLPTDMVTINLEVKMLKGQYMFSQNNNYNEMSFNPWSEDLQPSETFMRIVREMQIQPNAYYLEATMCQTLGNNFGINSYQPKLTVIEQENPQDEEPNRQIQSPCPSNWSDYLHVEDDTDNESTNKTEPLTDQLTTSTGTREPQNTCADAKTVVTLPQSVPQKQKSTSKSNTTEAMPIVVVGNANQIWEQTPSPSKTRPPYSTWTLVGPHIQKQDDVEQN